MKFRVSRHNTKQTLIHKNRKDRQADKQIPGGQKTRPRVVQNCPRDAQSCPELSRVAQSCPELPRVTQSCDNPNKKKPGDGRMDGWTHPLIEMRGRIKQGQELTNRCVQELSRVFQSYSELR